MPLNKKNIILIGYSGHAYVMVDAIYSAGGTIKGYCDTQVKTSNPYSLPYLGVEDELLLSDQNWVIAIGENIIRKKIFENFSHIGALANVQHKTAVLGFGVDIGTGTFIAANVSINAFAKIGVCSIINTGSIVEHECKVGDFSHIAPGAVLAGNVSVGNQTFIGANVVVKQGISIGSNVIVGSGTVVIRDIPDGVTVVGNPGHIIE